MFERNKARLKRKSRSTKRIKIEALGKRKRAVVFRSLKNIYVQLIDDEKGKVLFSVDSRAVKKKGFNLVRAEEVGKLFAQKALKAGYKEIVFDRSGYKFHGKVKALAEGARKEGLVF